MALKRRFLTLAGLALLALALSTQAASPKLTGSEVQRFVASLPEVQRLADLIPEAELPEVDESAELDLSHPMSSTVQSLRGHAEYDRFSAVAKQHGFSSLEQWGQTGDRVLRAYLALEMEQQVPGMQAEMARALQEIEQNPHFSPEQREQMKQILTSSLKTMDSVGEAPAADLEVVRPHLAELRRAMAQ